MTEPIAVDVDKAVEAYTSRAWRALGYASWEAYVIGEYGEQGPELPLRQRRAAAVKMHAGGMSVRAIAAVLRLAPSVAHRDATGQIRKSREESVYVIGSPDFRPVKIGKGNPERRLEGFQTGSPFLLEVLWSTPGSYDLERSLHTRFEPFRIRGEWYEFPPGEDAVTLVSAAAQEETAALAA